MNSTSVEITAGLGGFLVLFGLMLAVWFLGRDMTRRLRRMRMAEDERLAQVRRERAGRAGRAEPAERAEPTGAEGEQDDRSADLQEGEEPERDDPIG